MHFYEHHIGDFMRDTAHLTPVEECFYRRALDWYYANEKPLPADIKKVCRAIRAKTKQEISAVETIVAEFFILEDDGYHQSRCDREIEKYSELEPEREAKKANQKERQRRTREQRKLLFDILREHNIVPDFNAPMSELRRLVASVTPQESNVESHEGHAPVTRDNDVTEDKHFCDATATHTHYPLPIPTTQYNINSLSKSDPAKSEKPEVEILVDDWQPELGLINTAGTLLGYQPATTEKFELVLRKFKLHNLGLIKPEQTLILSLANWLHTERDQQPRAKQGSGQAQHQSDPPRQTKTPKAKERTFESFHDSEIYAQNFTAGELRKHMRGDESPEACILRLVRERFQENQP